MTATDRLTRADVMTVMGWTNSDTLDMALYRSRRHGGAAGKARFPEAGADGRWARADVEAYRDARGNRAMGLSADTLARVRRMAADGVKAPAIAAVVGCRPASVYRILRREASGSDETR